jgi:hypothetical protein
LFLWFNGGEPEPLHRDVAVCHSPRAHGPGAFLASCHTLNTEAVDYYQTTRPHTMRVGLGCNVSEFLGSYLGLVLIVLLETFSLISLFKNGVGL